MATKYEVPKGWILIQDANGNVIPFFLQVRSDDIHSSNSTIYNESICRLLSGINHKTYVETITSTSINGMETKLNSDYTYDCYCRISLGSAKAKIVDTVIVDGTKQGIIVVASLPFTTDYSSAFDVQATLSGLTTHFANASINVVPMKFRKDTGTSEYTIKKATIDNNANSLLIFITSDTEFDATTLAEDDKFLNSYVSIRVHGMANRNSSSSPDDITIDMISNLDSNDVKLG